MSRIIGIDLGTTNSLAGVLDSGFPVLFADEQGKRLTPSVVYFPKDGNCLVGHPARRLLSADPANTVSSVKRFMGRRYSELSDAEKQVDYPLEATPEGSIRIQTAQGAIAPEEISSKVLLRLREIAEKDLGEPVTRAVITVPAYFNDGQRSATKRAGELAGLTVERILNEPTAAALAYGLDKGKQRGRIAVFDLGGGTFDLSILELNLGVFEVRATHGNTRLGGDDIDRALATALLERIREQQPSFVPSPQAIARLREEAERVKVLLSSESSVTVSLPFLASDLSYQGEFSRAALESIAQPILEKTRAHCLRALADAGIRAGDLDEVILVGGQTRMPQVRKLVAEIFGKEPNIQANPDEAVALGAVLQAGILEGRVQDMALLDVTPLSLGIETYGGLMNVLIPRNTTIPVKRGEMFTTAVNQQRSMKIRALQGEREMAGNNWLLGEFDLEFEPAPRGVARVGVQFEIDANGILSVLARDIQTGTQKVVAIQSAVDVSDEKVEAMIAESVEHAFEDMSDRQWKEAELKARDMITATRQALQLLGDRLEERERAMVQAALESVESALTSGHLQSLKQASNLLDQSTQSLAEAMMDFAVEESLRRKGIL